MKTAISLPDDLFAAVDALARRLGMPRSRLVAEALAEYVAKHKRSRVTEQLDAVYSGEPSNLDEAMQRAGRRTLKRSNW